MRKLLVLVVLAAAAALSAVFAASAPSATRVNVGDNYFVRSSGVPTVTVSKGTRVKLGLDRRRPAQRQGRRAARRRSARARRSRGSYSKKVRRRGTYTIVCTVHGGRDQKMKLVVR